MPDFWKSSGFHLVRRNTQGWLELTPDYLRAYLTRPEIHPVDESCEAEHRLFETLMSDPFAPVSETALAAIVDPDARDNYRVVLRFRERLVSSGTIEGAYQSMANGGNPGLPPVFIDQMAHVILRNILDSATDPMRVRVAELFFREQTVSLDSGRVMLADAETVDTHAKNHGPGQLLPGLPRAEVSLDVLGEENKALYWARSDRYDTAIDLRFTEPALDALARVIEAWIHHFTKVMIRVQPAPSIRDERWSWHIGMDAESSRILNALYERHDVREEDLARILALFRMDILENRLALESMRGKPVYLGLAMTSGGKIRVKPQNLLANLPFRPSA